MPLCVGVVVIFVAVGFLKVVGVGVVVVVSLY